MKQGKEILEKHLKEMDSSLPPLDQLRMRLPSELVDLDDIYLERFLNSREGTVFKKKFLEFFFVFELSVFKKHEIKGASKGQPVRQRNITRQNRPGKWIKFERRINRHNSKLTSPLRHTPGSSFFAYILLKS